MYDNVSGSKGVYLKRVGVYRGELNYFKLSYFDTYNGFTGTESINEVIAGRLGRKLGLPVLYQYLELVRVRINGRYYTTYACRSESFKKDGFERMNAGKMFDMYCLNNENPMEGIRRLGFSDFVDLLLVWDYLMMGKDRHSGNIEFLNRNGVVRPAPIFDNGISFLYSIFLNDQKRFQKIKDYDVFKNNTANNFLGTRDLEYNLNYVRKPITVRKLLKNDRRSIFYNLGGVVPEEYLNKIWSIICYRYLRLRQLGLIVVKEEG